MSTINNPSAPKPSSSGETQPLVSVNPATGETVWQGRAATAGEVDAAVATARAAQAPWAQRPIDQRIEHLHRFASAVSSARGDLGRIISLETAKPRWEAATEVDAVAAKIPITIDAWRERRAASVTIQDGTGLLTRYKPHGVLAVLGPFNMPAHLPTGHIVPALLAGNAVVFKPSELAPLVGQRMGELWAEAGLPPGVLAIVQGERATGQALVGHVDVDGVLFTGSAAGGRAIARALADCPGKIVALEMGGNNPLVIWNADNVRAAACIAVQSAFITAGQRCTCARRLIVADSPSGHEAINAIVAMTRSLRVGAPDDDPEPFMGPVISDAAAEKILKAQQELLDRGARPLLPMQSLGPPTAMLSPGIIDVTNCRGCPDVEIFGPLLQVIRVPSFDRAIAEANNTSYGLSAALLSDRADLWDSFFARIRAGVIHWNRPTTGASSRQPFGGVGLSGNHRPAGFWSVDYCAYPVASMELATLAMPAKLPPGITP